MNKIQLCNKLECTGCTACANVCPKHCISMLPNDEGFLYPTINEDLCIHCGKCQKACPVLNPIERGRNPEVYAAWNIDNAVRTKSTSGGLFSALSKYVIDRNGVVFGVVKDKDKAFHTYADCLENIAPMRGSKYIQSEVRDSYSQAKDFLLDNRLVLFSGTPCQVAGLKSFLGDTPQDKLLTVETLCHGTPSSLLFSRYMDYLRFKYDACDFRFRPYERFGMGTSCFLPNGEWKALNGSDDIYMTLFLKDMIFRESCYNCKFATVPRYADITLADFWGIEKNTTKPLAGDFTKGCSLLLINSDKGHRFLESIRDNLYCEMRSLEEAIPFNPQLVGPCKRPQERDTAYQYIFSHSWKKVEYHYIYQTAYSKIRHFGRNLIDMLFAKTK